MPIEHYLLCAEPGCLSRVRVRIVAGRIRDNGRCPKCAAYHRGRMRAKESRRLQERHDGDETNGRAAIHAARGQLVAEFIRSGK